MDPAHAVPRGLSDRPGQPAGRRFDVYRNNVAVSLTEALEAGFPVVAKLIGDANFKAIAGVHLRQSPPTSPVLMQYGAAFPQFLRDFEPLGKFPYLGDVAALELAIRNAYHASDASPVTPEVLSAYPPEELADLTFAISPAVRIVRSPWPIYDLWAFNTIPGHPKPTAGAQDVVVLRPEFDATPHLLPPGGADFIDALQDGATLGDAAERAGQTEPHFDLSTLLGLLLGQGAFVGITHEDQK